MKRIHKITTGVIALILAFSMIFSTCASAAYIEDPGMEGIAELFNSSVNTIKEKRPAYNVIKRQGIAGTDNNDIAYHFQKVRVYYDLVGKVLDSGIFDNFLGGILGEFFFNLLGKELKDVFGSDNASQIDDLVNKITGPFILNNSLTDNAKFVIKGIPAENTVSVTGKPYVSALTKEDIYQYEFYPEFNGGYTIKIKFADEINPTENSPMGRVFDLIDTQKLANVVKTVVSDFDPKDAKFKYQNAYAECTVNGNGQLTYYKTHYEINLGLKDLVAEAFVFLDLSNAEIFDKSLYIVEQEYKDFNWNPILVGDVNSDDKINAQDARQVLRVYAMLDKSNEGIYLSGDVNGDGKTDAQDARLILRHAAKLQLIKEKYVPTVPQQNSVEENGSEAKVSELFMPYGKVLGAYGKANESRGGYYSVGDADLNGKVQPADARILLRIVARLEEYHGSYFDVINVNDKDTTINAADARLILRHCARLETLPQKTVFVLDSDRPACAVPRIPEGDDEGEPKQEGNINAHLRAPLYAPFDNPNKKYEDLSDFEYEVIRLVNVERAKVNLPPLEVSFELSEIARQRSVDMANGWPFSHYLDNKGNYISEGIALKMMKDRNLKYAWAGENIAAGPDTPQDVVNAWMNSPSHSANILRAEFTAIGVGFTNDTTTIYDTYWTQIFASPQK